MARDLPMRLPGQPRKKSRRATKTAMVLVGPGGRRGDAKSSPLPRTPLRPCRASEFAVISAGVSLLGSRSLSATRPAPDGSSAVCRSGRVRPLVSAPMRRVVRPRGRLAACSGEKRLGWASVRTLDVGSIGSCWIRTTSSQRERGLLAGPGGASSRLSLPLG
jgi:hypothetical protein